ncbi:MAG: MarR family transcriptional regulator [Gemmatimonadota bacterium]|nr:MarR family transcriptional regulator [Gemmatimonadota bacterium]
MKRRPASGRSAPPRSRVASRAPKAGTDAERTALKLWIVLSRAQSAVARHTEADVARHALTIAEFAILEALYHRGPLLLGELQRKILVSSGGVTYLVDRLEAKGLVERQECPDDRRARYAALTTAGEKLVKRIFPEHAQRIVSALSGLTKAEQLQATVLLRALGRAADEIPLTGNAS